MKKKLILILCSFLLLFSSIDVDAIVEFESNVFVNDYADILNDETEDYILYNSNYLKNTFDSEIFVVTIESLENYDIKEYSDEVYDKLSIGKNNSDKSILILLSESDREIRINVGTGYSYYFTDDLVTKYIEDYFMTYFEEGNWDKGIINGYNAFYKTICNFYDVDTSSIVVEDNGSFFYKHRVDLLLFGMIIIMFSFNYLYKFFIKKYIIKKKTEYYEEALFFIIVMIDVICFYYAFIFDILYFLILFASLMLSFFNVVGINDDNKKKKRNNKKKKRVRKV